MKKHNFLTLFLIPIFLLSCGQSEQERRLAQMRHDDSIKRVAAAIQLMRDQASINELNDKENLKQYIASLAEAKQGLVYIQGFQFLRTESEKEEQVRTQTLKIETLKDTISTIQVRIQNETSIINMR